MEKEKIFSKYFLEEIENTEDIKGWRIIGKISVSVLSIGVDVLKEYKTDIGGWLNEFRIKLMNNGLILVSPECPVFYLEESDEIVKTISEIYADEFSKPNFDLSKMTTYPGISNGNDWWKYNQVWCENNSAISTNTITSKINYASNYISTV